MALVRTQARPHRLTHTAVEHLPLQLLFEPPDLPELHHDERADPRQTDPQDREGHLDLEQRGAAAWPDRNRSHRSHWNPGTMVTLELDWTVPEKVPSWMIV